MSNRDKWRLCGGTFFILISDARKAMPSHDEMYMGKKSGITEPETLFALARIVTPDLPEPMSSEENHGVMEHLISNLVRDGAGSSIVSLMLRSEHHSIAGLKANIRVVLSR